MVTYEFYRDTYGGTADEASFARAASTAETVLRTLLFPTVTDDLSESQLTEFFRAVCVQADYTLASVGNARSGSRIKSESLGDRSVTYEYDSDGSAGVGLYVMGAAVAPEAVMLLENCGCLSRWV